MDNFNSRNLYNDDGWQNVSTSVVKPQESEPQALNDEIIEKKKKQSKHPVLTLQLIVAICFLLFLFTLKFLGTSVYDTIMNWYIEETSKSVMFNGDFESFDFSSVFATADEG